LRLGVQEIRSPDPRPHGVARIVEPLDHATLVAAVFRSARMDFGIAYVLF